MGDLLDVAKLEATDIVTERPQYLTDVDIQKLEGGQNVLQQHIKHLQAGLGTVKKHRETRYEGQCLRLSYLTDQLELMKHQRAVVHATPTSPETYLPAEHVPQRRRARKSKGTMQCDSANKVPRRNLLFENAVHEAGFGFKTNNRPRPVGGNQFYDQGTPASHLAAGAKRCKSRKSIAQPTHAAALKSFHEGGMALEGGKARVNPPVSTPRANARLPVSINHRKVSEQVLVMQKGPVTNVIDLLGSDDEEGPVEEEVSEAIRSKLEAPNSGDECLPPRKMRYSARRQIAIEKELEGLHYVYPEQGGVGAVDVNGHDLRTLQDMEFVNDKIMDYYSKRIHEEYVEWHKLKQTTAKIHFFNAFFFKKLTEQGSGCSFASTEQVTKEMYEKVCKWTKNVDIFDMDYILIPVHDTAHWSLAIVCHPGNMLFDKQQAIAAVERKVEDTVRDKGSSSDEKYKVLSNDALPLILHLDPIKAGGHDTESVCSALKQWLRYERQHHAEHRKDTRAGRHQAKHAHDLTQMSIRGAPLDDAGVVKIHRVSTIPHQDNYHDCGLYTLTYMEFFCYNTPQQIHCFPLNGSKNQLHMHFGNLQRDDDFLKATWFRQRNGSNLRFHLMVHLLENMIQKASRDGLRGKMQSALDTAAALKVDYQQRFQDDSGVANGDMYYTPKQKADDPARFTSKRIRQRQSGIRDSISQQTRTRSRPKHELPHDVMELDNEDKNNDHSKKRRKDTDDNYNPSPRYKRRFQNRAYDGRASRGSASDGGFAVAHKGSADDAVQHLLGAQLAQDGDHAERSAGLDEMLVPQVLPKYSDSPRHDCMEDDMQHAQASRSRRRIQTPIHIMSTPRDSAE